MTTHLHFNRVFILATIAIAGLMPPPNSAQAITIDWATVGDAGNALFTADGIAKLADFGLAHTHEASEVSMLGLGAGTMLYAAPEQLHAQLLALEVREVHVGDLEFAARGGL